MIKKKIIYILLILLIISSCNNYSGKVAPKPIEGALDLSNWDFKKDGPVDLIGEWEFYWGQLLEPGDFQKESKPEISTMIKVPSTWAFTIYHYITYVGMSYHFYILECFVYYIL